MSEPLIHDLEGLMAAFGVTSIIDLQWAIEEAAPIDDGRDVFIDDSQSDGPFLVVDTIGTGISFPTTVEEILQLAADTEQNLPDIPYWVITGDPRSRVIIHVPHASRLIPQDVRSDIVLDDDALDAELDAMTDAFTDKIAQLVAEQAGTEPWIFINKFSRLVVDPERFPDETEEMNAAGMGVIYTRTSTGADLRDESDAGYYDHNGLMSEFFDRYAQAFTDLVGLRLEAVDEVTIIDLHSFPLEALPYELHGGGPRPEICLGTDEFHTPGALTNLATESFQSFQVGINSPFSGCYVPLAHYGTRKEVSALMVEIRRDLYMDGDFDLVEPAVNPIVEGITALIDGIDPPHLIACTGMGLPEYELPREVTE